MPAKKSNTGQDVAADLKKIGTMIRAARKAAGMTQDKLAEEMDISTRGLQKIEAGQITMLVTTLTRLRRALKCNYDDVLPE